MLELRQIKKTYRVGEIETKALQGVSLAFRTLSADWIVQIRVASSSAGATQRTSPTMIGTPIETIRSALYFRVTTSSVISRSYRTSKWA